MTGDDTIDSELRDMIVATHTDMKHVRLTLQNHDDVIEEVRNQHDAKIEEVRHQHDERIRDLERTQSKIMTCIVVIGSAITLAMNTALDVLEKIRW